MGRNIIRWRQKMWSRWSSSSLNASPRDHRRRDMNICTRTKLVGFAFCTVAVFGGAATLGGAAQYASEAQKRDMVLWYRQPGEKWLEAMPIGNGYMGAMVFGGIHEERVALNE